MIRWAFAAAHLVFCCGVAYVAPQHVIGAIGLCLWRQAAHSWWPGWSHFAGTRIAMAGMFEAMDLLLKEAHPELGVGHVVQEKARLLKICGMHLDFFTPEIWQIHHDPKTSVEDLWAAVAKEATKTMIPFRIAIFFATWVVVPGILVGLYLLTYMAMSNVLDGASLGACVVGWLWLLVLMPLSCVMVLESAINHLRAVAVMRKSLGR